MLIAIETAAKNAKPVLFKSILKNKHQTYHLGIIDYLQQWNLQKKGERLCKSLLHRNVYNSVSAVPPDAYQARFYKFLERHVIKPVNNVTIQDEFIRSMLGDNSS